MPVLVQIVDMTQKFSPIQVTGISHIIDRLYREGQHLQFVRECIVNAAEAGASRIHFGIDPRHPRLRRLVITDDGHGMNRNELESYMGTLGSEGSSKSVGGHHENFGVGAKTSLLPWNPNGVIVASWTKANPQGHAVRLARVENEYGVADNSRGLLDVVPRPEWMKTGTLFMCLGSERFPNTWDGPAGDGIDIFDYIATRFWDLPLDVHVDVMKKKWSHTASCPDRLSRLDIESSGNVDVGSARVHWYITKKLSAGIVGTVYRGEIYHVSRHPASHARFGIFSSVRDRIHILVEPHPFNEETQTGCFPNSARSQVMWWNNGKATDLPIDVWGEIFASKMPEELITLMESSVESSKNDAWKKKLIEFLGRMAAHLRRTETGVNVSNHRSNTDTHTRSESEKESKPRKPKNVALPDFRFVDGSDVGGNFAGIWVPRSPGAPNGEIVLNRDFTVFKAVVSDWCRTYAHVPKRMVEDVIHTVYGELTVAGLVHGSVLNNDSDWGRDRVDKYINSPEGITVMTLGLINAHERIRVAMSGRFGKGKVA